MALRIEFVFLVAFALGCESLESASVDPEAVFRWRQIPSSLSPPPVPEDNPMSAAKVELGRMLFYDVRLSGNQTQACSTCHVQARAFSDSRPASLGSKGEAHPRNTPGLANVAYISPLTWANPLLTSLEKHSLVPLLGESPLELGAAGRVGEVLSRLAADARYQRAFEKAFPRASEPISLASLVMALASFQRSLLSFGAPYDRFSLLGEHDALSASARRGAALFFSDRLRCAECHRVSPSASEPLFFNTGLYNLDGEGRYPLDNTGLYEITAHPPDMGRFRAPSLRNVAVTGPYMHDGSVRTLSEAIDIYARGGRRIDSGPFAGDGAKSPLKSALVGGFVLSDSDKEDLLSFLRSLTDPGFLSDPRFSDPWGDRP